ncbi:uncharacterized protein M421DRAFT_394471 [Didymella exigua CBS 183.55]|uniref:Cytochrome b561 domain-containing protein n=1 Tax=Didymella exigua CBS 183.55 TaxID=1150837 RepID=A0A6A5RI21_9PLEO|nr:uncharacterized protein M421DRAFT_394471 [Didymella exigua CBS 183.55]KAF1926890.1 hypothetical protein M421DRAFT_394471 [Didymella exigua CBS 183.55]
MFGAGKRVWHLPLAVFAIAALLFTFAGLGYDRYVFTNTLNSNTEGFTAFLSADTITAIKDDARLHHALLSFTESIAHTSSDLGHRLDLSGVQEFGHALSQSVVELRKRHDVRSRKRSSLDDVSQVMESLLFEMGLNTTGGLSAIVGNLGTALTGGLATPALFLGIGVGVGASTGLNITDMMTARAQASMVASAFNASATGINLAAQNIGSGLARQITPCLSQSNMMNMPIGPAAYALASGIGNSTAKALNLTNEKFPPSNDSGIVAVAGNLGLGVSAPIVSNIDFQAVVKSVGGNTITTSLMQQLPQIAAAAGNGLGEGAKIGLRFGQTSQVAGTVGKRQTVTDLSQGVDVPGAVNLFTKGFSQSLLMGVDVASLSSSLNLTGTLGGMMSPAMLSALAAGAGSGIGMGLAIGFQFKDVNAAPLIVQSSNTSSDSMQTAIVAETLAQNLISNFLLNSTVPQAVGATLSDKTPQLLKNADVSRVMEGFARGTIEGISTALSSVGGLQNLLSGNFSDNALINVPALEATKFNDSVNGSAVGFARGFMGEGTILIGDVLKKMNQNANGTGSSPDRKRDAELSAGAAATVPYNIETARQFQNDTSATTTFPLAINEATVMGGVQMAINTLTCQGIGGIASITLGAVSQKKNKISLTDMVNIPLDPRVAASLPQGPVEFTSDGNTFRIVLKDAEISINGLPVFPFGVLTALHVLFVMLAFLLTLPLYLILGVVWRLSVLAGYPVNEVKNKKWRMGLLITFGVSAVIGIIFGMIGMGNSRHFRDGHGVFGLIALILVLPTVGFTVVRLRSEAIYPLPANFSGIKAPFALFKSADQRIYLVSGILVQLVFTLGQITFINGFSTLRSISLCIVDAVLTSSFVAGLMGVLLMVQITAGGMVGIRTWLEQHIAKREKAGVQRMIIVEAGTNPRKNSIAMFGFGGTRLNAPPHLDLDRSQLVQRNTEELKGFADETISTPFNVRKEGAPHFMDFERPRRVSPQPSAEFRENPFLSPAKQRDLDERVYPKTADYQYKYTSAVGDSIDHYSVPAGYQPERAEIRSGRPSSDIIDPMNSPIPPGLRDLHQSYVGSSLLFGSPPKTHGVTMADLFPPPPAPPMDLQMQLTAKSVSNSYSRPFNEGRRPSRDELRGAGRGTGVSPKR